MRLFPLPPTGGPMRPKTQIWLHKPTNTRQWKRFGFGLFILIRRA